MDESQIRTLKDGEKITKPGFYRISLERHHNQPCDGPSVTSGTLRQMELDSPKYVWDFHPANPNRFERETTPAINMGKAMAAFVEGGVEQLMREFMVLPEKKPRRPTEAQIDAIKNGKGTTAGLESFSFWAKVDADPRDVITKADVDQIIAMGKVLKEDPAAAAALGGIPEITMAYQDAETGIWVLSRPDQVAFSGMVGDYKKTSPMGHFNGTHCDIQIDKYGYDMQIALAATAFENLTGEWPQQCGLVFQMGAAPYHVILRPLDEEDLRIGQFRNQMQIRAFAECWATGYWPGPGDHISPYRRQKHNREMWLERMNTAGEAP